MARINVFLSDNLIEALDREAKRARTNRSALVHVALSQFLDAQRKAREEEARRRKMEEACRGMDNLAEKLGDWDPVPTIRRFRDARPGPRK